MGVFNSGLQSMTWEEDYVDAASGSVVDGTWYEVTNYSGIGRLAAVGLIGETNFDNAELKITTDSNAHTLSKTSTKYAYAMFAGSGIAFSVPFNLEFTTSLVVEIRRDGDTLDIEGWSSYGILSKEINREIINAGQPVPDRNGNPRPITYTDDIMLVWFRGSSGLSNKVVHPIGDTIDLPQNKILTPSYNLIVGGPRYDFVQSSFTGTKQIIIDGTYYDITVNNGVIELTSVPYLITRDAFIDRFTPDEITNIINASHEHPNGAIRKGLQDFVFQIQSRQKINLRWVALQTKVNQLHSVAGLIASHRPAQILATA